MRRRPQQCARRTAAPPYGAERKPYVIERGWLRGVGDKLGDARIERIEGGSV
jgi:hypothetical protein